jgi:hypothetical protein
LSSEHSLLYINIFQNELSVTEKTTTVWPRQKDARGENTKINYGLDTMEEKEKRTSKKKNVDGRNMTT